MEELWQEYLSGLDEDFFDGMQAERSRRPTARVDDAINIASEALYEKKDPVGGTPAILSALNVALSFRKENDMIAAALRDVIGQDGWTPGRLRERGFSERIVDTLILLHREKGESDDDHLRRIARSADRPAFRIKERELEMRWEQSRGQDRMHLDYALMLLRGSVL